MNANLSPITNGKLKKQSNILLQSCDVSSPDLRRFVSTNVATFRPHKCDICEKKFKKIGERNQHVRAVHLNVRPFKCDTCSKDFPKKCKLTRHIDQVLCIIQTNYFQQSCGSFELEYFGIPKCVVLTRIEVKQDRYRNFEKIVYVH
jgi:uncharacterized Zn-finger protein